VVSGHEQVVSGRPDFVAERLLKVAAWLQPADMTEKRPLRRGATIELVELSQNFNVANPVFGLEKCGVPSE
jgi:hypothetical protein